MVGRGHVDDAGRDGFPVPRVPGLQGRDRVEQLRQDARRIGRHVQDHEDGRRKIGRQGFHEGHQGGHPAGGRANDDDIPVGRLFFSGERRHHGVFYSEWLVSKKDVGQRAAKPDPVNR